MRNITLTVLFAFMCFFTFAQINNDVVGKWYNAEKDAVITIFEDNKTISGKITWMKFPNDDNGNPKTDPLNPDDALKSRPRLGMVMMSGFTHIEANEWDNGTLYDPKKGKTYSGKITLTDKNTLDLRGYIGFSFIGRSSVWTRKLE
tara:strand:- start:85 stop:522 length:438 start_codon:yes stop_codon:yes gene_type:complete